MSPTGVRLDPYRYERLRALASREPESFAQLVREGVDDLARGPPSSRSGAAC